MPTVVSAQQLAEALAKTHRTEYLPADPPNAPAEGVNIWAERDDRYPWTTIWAPIPDVENSADWLWGPSFQYGADGDIGLDELVEKVLESIDCYFIDNPR
jgi:hypothetical protein